VPDGWAGRRTGAIEQADNPAIRQSGKQQRGLAVACARPAYTPLPSAATIASCRGLGLAP